MALGADFDMNLGLRGTGNELIATVARNLGLIILRLNILLHLTSPLDRISMGGADTLCPFVLYRAVYAGISQNSNMKYSIFFFSLQVQNHFFYDFEPIRGRLPSRRAASPSYLFPFFPISV